MKEFSSNNKLGSNKTSPFLHLQKGLQQPFFFQPKLTINQPGDIYEQEADAVAEKVMRMPANENTFFKPPANLIQRKCDHYEEEEKKVQMSGKAGNAGGVTAPLVVNEVINSTGQSLDAGTKNFMESRFGYDFGSVQVHNDRLAHQSSDELNALAYTHGSHIVFGNGQYQPGTNSGRQLLAHELTHVVQQASGTNFLIEKKIAVPVVQQSVDEIPKNWDRIYSRVWNFMTPLTKIIFDVPDPSGSERRIWLNQLQEISAAIGAPGEKTDSELSSIEARLSALETEISDYVAAAQKEWIQLEDLATAELNELDSKTPHRSRAKQIYTREYENAIRRVTIAFDYLIRNDYRALDRMVWFNDHYTIAQGQIDAEAKAKREREARRLRELGGFRRFSLRGISGGALSIGPAGTMIYLFELKEDWPGGRTGQLQFFSAGASGGARAGAEFFTSSTDFTTGEDMSIEDFEGGGRVASAAAAFIGGLSYSVVVFYTSNKKTIQVEGLSTVWGVEAGAIWTHGYFRLAYVK